MHAWSVLLLLLATALAGCASSDDETPTTSGSEDDPLGASPDALHPLAFDLASPWETGDMFEGSVGPTDTANTGAAITGSFQHAFDIGNLMPPGVPALVSATLEFEAVTHCNFGFYLNSAEATFYSYNGDGDCTHESITATVLGADDLQVVFEAYSPGDGAPTTPFAIEVLITADADAIPAGVPITARLGPNETVRTTDGAAFHVWDGRDQRVASAVSTFTTPSDGSGGEYVLLPAARTEGLVTDAAATTLRALGFDATFGADHELALGEPVSWTTSVRDHPVGVAVWLHSGPAVAFGASVFAVSELEVTATAPDGTDLVSESGACSGFCGFGGTFGAWFPSALGDPSAAPGEYTFTVSNAQSTNIFAQEAILRYVR